MDGCFHAFPLFHDCEGGIVTRTNSDTKLRSKLNVLRSDLEDGDMETWVSIPSSVGLLRVFPVL